jgi:hypothetical protein
MMCKLNGKWLCGTILAVTLAGLSGQAMAGRAFQITDYFYGDDTHQGPILGQTTYFCGAGSQASGQSTPYVVSVQVSCTGDAPDANPNSALPTWYHNCELTDPIYQTFTCYG